MLQFTDLTLRRGPRLLFEQAGFQIHLRRDDALAGGLQGHRNRPEISRSACRFVGREMAAEQSQFEQNGIGPRAEIRELIHRHAELRGPSAHQSVVHELLQSIGEQIRRHAPQAGLQIREARRSGADTTSIESQIADVRSNLQAIRSQYSEVAQACADPSAIGELVAAEALMDEVRQAVSLLAVESTRETPEGFGSGGRRGRGPGGPGR